MALLKTVVLTVIGALHALVLRIRQNPIESQIVFVVLLLIAGWLQLDDQEEGFADGRIMLAGDVLAVDTLEQTYGAFGYSLNPIRNGDARVPRLIAADVPDGLKDIRVIDRRKRLFFRTVLPMILTVNESISNDRSELLGLSERLKTRSFDQSTLSADELAWLTGLATRYGIDVEDEDVALEELLDALKLRVAPIPPSLALAQSVEESAWGTSRFAREGNALFGQWVWNEDAGIVPERQRQGQEYAVRAFETPLQSVFAYAHNLNTHWAYTDFREKRGAMLQDGQTLDGWVLAETLTQYSERRENYVESLHAIMRVNKLRPFDKARLASPDAMTQLAEAD